MTELLCCRFWTVAMKVNTALISRLTIARQAVNSSKENLKECVRGP